jgi:protein-S-isoprenylcysteine O-methyltransferase Ste14
MIHHIRDYIAWPWAALAGFWLLAALRRKRAIRKQPIAGRALEMSVLLVAAVLLFYQWPHIALLNQRIIPGTAAMGLAGLAVTVAGVLFAITARVYLGTNWSGRPSIKEGHELIYKGPYRLVRHPIYTGLLLAATGSAVAFGLVRCLLALPVVLLGFWWKVRAEEQMLTETMNEQYSDYRRRVRSAFIPFIL